MADRKLDVLRSIPSISADQIVTRTPRPRYTAGDLAETGEPVPSYVDEPGVNPQRCTETYAEVMPALRRAEPSATYSRAAGTRRAALGERHSATGQLGAAGACVRSPYRYAPR